MNLYYKFILICFIPLLSCNSQKNDATGKSTPLISKDTTSENERDNRLFVFVGEKIDVTPIPPKPGDFDNALKAKYRILQRVYGYYDKDIIEFEAYDHFGDFPFAQYKNVLMYVSEYEGKWYHERYIYDPVFKTKDGRWAGPYSDNYGHVYNESATVKPEKIEFSEEVSLPTSQRIYNWKDSLGYSEKYYKIVGDRAIVIYGNYVPQLFKLKREGILTARQLFGDKKAPEVSEITVQNVKDTTKK